MRGFQRVLRGVKMRCCMSSENSVSDQIKKLQESVDYLTDTIAFMAEQINRVQVGVADIKVHLRVDENDPDDDDDDE